LGVAPQAARARRRDVRAATGGGAALTSSLSQAPHRQEEHRRARILRQPAAVERPRSPGGPAERPLAAHGEPGRHVSQQSRP
jgi:hypothetical protein